MIRLALFFVALFIHIAPISVLAQEASSLPLLNNKRILGTTLYGSGSVETLSDPMTSAIIDQGVSEGMNGFTFYEDWTTLEPEPGVYELDELEATLKWLQARNITPYLNITVVDIDNLNLFDEWLNDDGTAFSDDFAFNNEQIIGRFKGLLDQVIPLLLDHGGFYLGVGNEIDSRYATDGPLLPEKADEFNDYLEFIAASVDHAHIIEPELAIGVTVTSVAPLENGIVFEQLLDVTDVLPVDYYGLKADFETEDLDRIPEIVDTIISAYGTESIIVQETGCISTEAANSSLDIQADCMDVILSAWASHPQVKYVSVFSLYDLDEQTCSIVTDLFGTEDEDLPQLIRDRIIGFLCDPGMIEPDGTPKPAWFAFLNNAAGMTSTALDRPVQASPSSIQVYPNPVRKGAPLHYAVPHFSGTTRMLSVHDLLGRTVIETRVTSTQGSLQTNLTPGMYFLRVQNEHQEQLTKPFLVVR